MSRREGRADGRPPRRPSADEELGELQELDGPPEAGEAVVAADLDAAGEGRDDELEEGEERQARAPWHFKLIAVGTIVYLAYRLYQGIGWLAHHL